MPSETARNRYDELEPKVVWGYFAELAAVPRPSKREERVRRHVRTLAEQRGFTIHEDRIGNLVIEVPASTGYGHGPITVLQAHLDMVCEKNASAPHDFEKEGIRLLVETESSSGERIVRADGTTLGADNGIGVALALAAATSPEVIHGPLELLFTIDEEEGMSGAKALHRDSFRGRRMLNLDSEEDDALYIGCAGGCDIGLVWTFPGDPIPHGMEVYRVSVSGLRGGHSGVDIHEGRANAIKILARTLLRAGVGSLCLSEISGGSKRNAIPREASAVVAGPAGMLDSIRQSCAEVSQEVSTESLEPGAVIHVERWVPTAPVRGMTSDDTSRVLSALAALPSGVLGMHPKVAGLVETSNNVSTIVTKTQGSQTIIEVGMLPRSSSSSRMRETLDQLAAIGQLSGAKAATGNAYPGWSPNPDSATLAVCRRVYQELFAKEPRIAAIHAGLECGIIGEGVGGMDMVSLGPTIRGAHSPDERVYVNSVARTWRYLNRLLSVLGQ